MTTPLLYNDNALQKIKDIPDNTIDLVLVDPPYLIDYKNWDSAIFQGSESFNTFTEDWVKECFRVLKPNGSFWSFMGYQNIFPFFQILEKYGTVHYENWVVWARQKGRGSSKHLKSVREDIIHVTKSKKDFIWNNIKMLREVIVPYVKDGKPRGWFLDENGKRVRWTGLGNVWVYSAPQWNGVVDKQVHPSQKPTMMLERMILLSSNEGDVVLDPFMGSGSTGVACVRTDRNFIGIEQDKKFFEIAQKRIQEAKQ